MNDSFHFCLIYRIISWFIVWFMVIQPFHFEAGVVMRIFVSVFRFSSQCVLLAHVPSENTKWSRDGSLSHLSQGTCTRLTSSKSSAFTKMAKSSDVWRNKNIFQIAKMYWFSVWLFDNYRIWPFSFSPYSPAGASRPRAELLPGGHEAGGCRPEKSPLYLPSDSRCIAWSWGAGHLWWLARSLWLLLPLWLKGHLPCWLVCPHWRQSSATWHERYEPHKYGDS